VVLWGGKDVIFRLNQCRIWRRFLFFTPLLWLVLSLLFQNAMAMWQRAAAPLNV